MLVITVMLLAGRRVGNKLGRLVDVSTAIAAGDFNTHAPENGKDEFSHLGRSLNRMVDAVVERNTALSDSKAQLNAMLDNPSLMIGLLDTSGRVQVSNKAVLALRSNTMAEITGVCIWDMDVFSHDTGVQCRIRDAVKRAAHGEGSLFDITITTLQGIRAVEFSLQPVKNEAGKVTWLVPQGIDITERKQAQDALERERGFLSALIRTIPDLVWLKDPDGVYLACNPRFEQLFNAKQDDIVGRTDYDFVDKDTAEFFREHDLMAMQKGTSSVNEEWLTFASDGHRELSETTKTPMVDAQGRLIGVLGIAHDITARKRMEDELRENDERFRTLFELSADAAVIVDGDRFVECNQAAVVLFGFASKEDFLDIHPSEVSPQRQPDGEDSYTKAERMLEIVRDRGVNRFEWLHMRGDGSEFYAEVALSAFSLRGKQVVYSIVRDISDRKRAETELASYRENLEELVDRRTVELRESQRQLSMIIENIPAVFVVKDFDGRYQLVNRRLEEAVGMAREEIIGHTDREVLSGALAEAIMGKDQQVMETGGSVEFEHRAQHPDGSIRTYLTTKVPMPDEHGRHCALISISTDITQVKQLQDELAKAQAIANLGSWRFDLLTGQLTWSDETYRIFGVEPGVRLDLESFIQHVHPDDREALGEAWAAALAGEPYDIEHRIVVNGVIKWVREQAEMQFDSAGNPIVGLGSVQDISDIKQAQIATQAALGEAQRLAQSKSEFLANMSHEIRTPLNAVLGMARIGIREDQGRNTLALWQRVLGSGEHLLGVINDILDYSKIEAGKFSIESRPFQLTAAVNAAVEAIGGMAKQKGLAMHVDIGPGLPAWVQGDAQRLQQILLNLMSNAVKFTEHGRVGLHVGNTAHAIELVVSDSGTGMSEDQVSRLFQPFEQADTSTTRRYGGTGLGLVITRDLVTMMGGTIGVDSRLGEGSVFTVRLPLPPADAPATSGRDIESEAGGRLEGIRVLAAEDVEANRFVLDNLLQYEGAKAVFAYDGQHAVDLIQEKGVTAFDVVLMDIQMPVVDGYEATRRILSLAPDLPIIGLTAHALEDARRECLTAGMLAHVTKPVDPDELVETILTNVGGADASPLQNRKDTARAYRPESQSESGEQANSGSEDGDDGFVDWAALMERFNRREGFIGRLIDKALLSIREKPGKLRAAADAADLETLVFVAHSMKGIAGNLMANSIFESSRTTEGLARSGDAEALESARRLAVEIESLIHELEQHVAGLQAADAQVISLH